MADARKSVKANTWAADELEIWGVRGLKRKGYLKDGGGAKYPGNWKIRVTGRFKK